VGGSIVPRGSGGDPKESYDGAMGSPSSGGDAVRALVQRGVVVPRPDLVAIDPAVDPARIEPGAEIFPGARVEGKKTLIGRGSRLGTAGPVVVRDCALGRGVELASGAFEGCVFLDGSSFGPGAQARPGTLFEERARAAHTVGTKHTILLPYVTLGSLINFCDCLMSGGTGDSDHSEVGSGFIHFNFTPAGDKATPSLFGDATRGVFLREPRIFLGGNAGAVGPLRVGYGSVLAAGSVYRHDYGEGMLALGEGARAESRKIDVERIRGARPKVRKNLEYLAELVALHAFHAAVRARLAGPDPVRAALVEAGAASLRESIAERIRQLEKLALVLARSAGKLAEGASGTAPTLDDEIEYQRGFAARLEGAKAVLAGPGSGEPDPDRDRLLATVPAAGAEYLAWVRGLSADDVAAGRRWLGGVRARYLDAVRV
jgi:acetyltransferase-like isoleucine patch superfamily enzyme